MFRVGLLGLSGSGKSTLFELLTGTTADPAAVGRSGQVAVMTVPDDRIEALQPVFGAARVVRPSLELLDTPGIDPSGLHQAGHTLGMLRAVDGLLYVLNTRSDLPIEAAFATLFEHVCASDRSVLEGRSERIETALKKPKPAAERQQLQAEWEDVRAAIEQLRAGQVPDQRLAHRAAARGYALLSAKPRFVVLNVDDDRRLDEADRWLEQILPQVPAVAINARLESELRELDPEDRALFMEEWGVAQLRADALHRLIPAGLGLITFYTGNHKEVRAWLVPRCTTALRAAGLIHSDMERGFIRAEVARSDQLIQIGSDREAHRQGAYHSQGKDYHVEDGDVLLIRFSV